MRVSILLIISGLIFSCSESYLAKPKGYNRLDLPEIAYQSLPDTFPYSFEYSRHARLLKDTSWISENYWVDLHYPELGAHVQVTYKPINADSTAESYLMDSYRLTAKHNIKAYSIDESIVVTKSGNIATVSDLTGDVPSPFQFHMTDSTDHFIRASLYFETATKNDSLEPSINYVKNDLYHLINTLEWKY